MPRIQAGSLSEHHDLVWTSLLDALDRLLAAEGPDSFTLARVAAEAGIARNTIYNYARDKQDLLAAAAERAGNDLAPRISGIARGPGTAPERLSATVDALLSLFVSGTHRHLLLQSLTGALPHDVGRRAGAPFASVFADLTAIVEDGTQHGHFGVGGDPGLTTRLVSGTLAAAVHEVAADPAALASVRERTVHFLLGALAPGAGGGIGTDPRS
ncbi:TetR/AcrR family transcriptional regulator [Nocardiopsis sp. HNM0947]|uniref:TetR/AcrR family transcriptional regulator n=1 Tax=Nocardiopsis coralli TaxID=2772213 RepID=A0ABR9P2F3_9ACTN|nr:TetR/AcrR family transcriptional regulator [Nocardiopsis coralli]MBE2997935.1 TetR/AcrR family transcriptional regulator [Nocardiopsis coralli]